MKQAVAGKCPNRCWAGLQQDEEDRVKNLFDAGKLLFLDMAATLFFLLLYLCLLYTSDAADE